jgi:phage gp37-like protein
MTTLASLPPLDTAPLFPALHAELMQLLRALQPDDWQRPTVAGAWRVHDVVAHLLDGELRTLSAHRDGHRLPPDQPVRSYNDVVALIQRLNAEGVAVGRRLSPVLLTALLDLSGQWMSQFVADLDPEAPALYAVAWAGEQESTNRFDTAREYTERWHHQMQIRMALGESRGQTARLLVPRLFEPLLATAVHVLPHAYRACAAVDGTSVVLHCVGDTQGAYSLVREAQRWVLYLGAHRSPTVHVTAPASQWWQLFFNALNGDAAHSAFVVAGDATLAEPLLRARSVMV